MKEFESKTIAFISLDWEELPFRFYWQKQARIIAKEISLQISLCSFFSHTHFIIPLNTFHSIYAAECVLKNMHTRKDFPQGKIILETATILQSRNSSQKISQNILRRLKKIREKSNQTRAFSNQIKCSQYLVDQCDILLVLHDGKNQQINEVIKLALAANKTVQIIDVNMSRRASSSLDWRFP